MLNYSRRIRPGQPVLYFPNGTTAWIGEVEYVEPKTVMIAWGDGDSRVLRQVPREHVIPLPFAPRLGTYKRVEKDPNVPIGLTYAVCPACDNEFEVEVYAEDLFEEVAPCSTS